METIELSVNFGGAIIDVALYPEDHFLGTIYPVEMNGEYYFTIHMNDTEDWSVMREPNGNVPAVDDQLLKEILRKLEYQLRYAA